MSGLSDYLQRLNKDSWSLRRISQEAERHGHQVNYTTVRKYLNGEHGAPSAEVLAALAAAFRVDVNDMRDAASRPGVGEPFQLGAESARLTASQRDAVRHVVRVMLEHGDELEDLPQPDGITPGERRRGPSQDDFARAADDSGPSLLEADDAQAAARGEESQDPGDWA